MSSIYKQICTYCNENFWRCKCDAFHPTIEIKDTFEISSEDAANLRKYFDTVGYISYEFHSQIHEFIAKLDLYLKRVM